MVNAGINAQLNLTNDHKKKESPYLQACPAPVVTSCMTKMTWVCLSRIAEKRKVVAASSYEFQHKGERWVHKQRATVQHGDNRQGEKRKMADCFTLLWRITRLIKSVNLQIKSEDQSSYLERYSPKGSCHLDESSMSHTLPQNCHCEFCCGVHLTCKNNPVTPDRNRRVFGVEWRKILSSPPWRME